MRKSLLGSVQLLSRSAVQGEGSTTKVEVDSDSSSDGELYDPPVSSNMEMVLSVTAWKALASRRYSSTGLHHQLPYQFTVACLMLHASGQMRDA